MNPTKPSALFLLLFFLLASLPTARAEQFGLFTYEVKDGVSVTITDYPEDATGEVEIPAEIDGLPVTEIGWEAFHGCAGLTSVTIPEGVTSIGAGAFRGCSGMTSLSIPDNVTSIGGGAFSGCTGLTSLTIPSSVTSIYDEAFRGCTGLTLIEVDALNPSYRSLAGVLFDKDLTLLIQYPGGETGGYAIPDSVTSIGSSAFSDCTGLTSLTIPKSITEIHKSRWEASIFSGCSNLISIDVMPDNPVYASHEGVLLTVDRTEIIACPEGKQGTYSIPEGVTGIGSIQRVAWGVLINFSAFSGCRHLTRINIPASVTAITWWAFRGCDALTTLEVQPGNPVYASHDGVLLNATRTAVVLCPRGKAGTYPVPDGVTTIGERAFYGCTGVTSLSISDSVTSIGRGAFSGCTGLTSLTIPSSVTSIYDEAFLGCTSLTSVSIPDSVNFIGYETFYGCRGLTSITIPDSVSFIDEYAFSGCSGLTSLSIPDSVTSISDGAFSRCTGLTSAIFLGDAPHLGGNSFANTAPEFTIYYLAGSTGFTSPNWNGHPTVMLDESTYPAAPWLVTHGLPYDTELKQDLNGDGVSLLMAYALDLDPKAHLQRMMPTPVVNGSSLGLSFHAAAPGITYLVETSTDLHHWTTDGVNWSELAEDGHRTASVERDGPQRFLRLRLVGAN